MEEISLTLKDFTFPDRGLRIEVAILSMDIDPSTLDVGPQIRSQAV